MTSGADVSEERGGEERGAPTLSRSARTLWQRCEGGVLSTIDGRDGIPYGSWVELIAEEEGGGGLMVLSELAAHTTNLKLDGRASIWVVDPLASAGERLSRERMTVMGRVARVERSEALEARWLERHPDASGYLGLSDFGFYRLEVERVRYIAGFGRMGWIEGEAWRAARPSPLHAAMSGIITHMNEDHGQNLRDYVREFAPEASLREESEVVMVGVDEWGIELEVGAERARLRLSFEQEASSAGMVRKELVRMARRARGEL